MSEMVDGEYQKLAVESGAYVREAFLRRRSAPAQDGREYFRRRARTLRHGGHDPRKVYAAYKAATEHKGGPTVILARTIKGYGLGEAGEGKNVTHQQKKLNEDELKEFRTAIRYSRSATSKSRTLHSTVPPRTARRCKYLTARRKELGGYVPQRSVRAKPVASPKSRICSTNFDGQRRPRSFHDHGLRRHACERCCAIRKSASSSSRSFPTKLAPSAWNRFSEPVGIYSSVGQLYEPVDINTLLYYREAKDGQILEEGITEAGSMASFIAAGSAYATHGINTIPFFIYYSMFGFQRIGDLIWAAADMRVPRIPARRHRRPHHAFRRRPSAPGRQQPHPRAYRSQPARLRSRLRDTNWP